MMMRRQWMVSLLAVMAVAVSMEAGPSAPDVVSGKVFLDANGNGKLDSGEKGLPRVRVTDGVQFETSGEDGSYTLTVADDPSIPSRFAQTVGVCWPTGYWPTGPWYIRLSDVKDAGAVHFALRKDEQKLPFIYLHMTDPHEHFNNNYLPFAEFVNALPSDVKFIIDTGDSYRPKSAEEAFNRLFFSTVGNHDTWEAPDPPPEGRYGAWTDRLGPVRWSFDHAGIHFVGIDVIEGVKLDAAIDWLEKDLAAVPSDTRIVLNYHYPDLSGPDRFARLLRECNIEIVQGGHSHAYASYTGEGTRLMTAYHWGPPGVCNIASVADDGIHVGVVCIGCKKSFGRHSRRCPVNWAEHILLSGIGGLFEKTHTMELGPLAGARTVKVTAPHVFIDARITPASAKRISLKIGAGDTSLEVVYADERLIVDGASYPFAFRPGQATLDLMVFAHHNLLTMWANNVFFIEKDVVFTRAADVTVSSEGGTANIESMTVQEVRSDPENRVPAYYCGCAHGSLRRNPVPR